MTSTKGTLIFGSLNSSCLFTNDCDEESESPLSVNSSTKVKG